MSQAQPAAEAPAQERSWEARLWSIGKQAVIFFAVQYAIKSFMGGGTNKPAAPQTNAPQQQQDGSPASTVNFDYSNVPQTVFPLWPSNATVDISVYVSPSIAMPLFGQMPPETLVVEERGFELDMAKKENREVHASFPVPKQVQDNGTLWAHIFIGQSGAVLDPAHPAYDAEKAYRMLWPLTQYLPKRKVRKTRNLLSAQNTTTTTIATEDSPPEEPEDTNPSSAQTASYYHPNITLAFVPSPGTISWPTFHPVLKQFFTLSPHATARDPLTGRFNATYYPLCYPNTFWQLRSHMSELNTTHPIPRLELNVKLSTLAYWQFSIMASMDEGMKDTARKAARGESTAGGGDGSEFELIKETLLDTNPWLLATTGIVSVLHMIFEMLAFKSDVGHWRKKKDNVGVSVRTILSNVVMQSIILLYLMDNNENTSWMILFGQGVGVAIEAWKITKTVNVRVRAPGPGSWAEGILPYVVVFEDKHVLSETEEKTEEYDRIAFYWMGVGAVPLLLAYAAYSLVYDSHKSWYSFVITTLVGSVYAYGFLMMIPSLYINYRLQSVAHMPAKAMTYKFLNTFIDDLFAFTIRMPLLHRLATLRDDLIFFVYIYQAWKYKVDYTRVNEFGQGGEGEESEVKTAVEPLKAPARAAEGKGDVAVAAAAAGGKATGSGAGKGEGDVRKRKG